MKRLIWLSLLLVGLTLLPTAPVQAISIGFSPLNQTIGAGGMGTVDIVVSNRNGVEIGAFGFDVLFDPAIISLTGITFGLQLGDPVLEALSGSVVGAGMASLTETSFLTVAELQALQMSDSFVLATLNFNAIGVGVSALSFANTDFVDGSANNLSVEAQIGSVAAVPEPSTMVLLGSALIGVAVRRRAIRGR